MNESKFIPDKDGIIKSPALYVEVTNRCNKHCQECYIFHKRYENDHILLGDTIQAIETLSPSRVIFSGGEPLLYPKVIEDIILYHKAQYKLHWNSTLCSNLIFPTLTEDQLSVIRLMDDVQSTYSCDRFLSYKKNEYEIWKDNLQTVKDILKEQSREECRDKYLDIIVTLTRKQLKEDPRIMYEKIPECVDGIGLEFLSFSDPSYVDDDYYKQADEYMMKAFEIIPKKRNLITTGWDDCLNKGMTMNCNSCNNMYNKIITPDGSIINGCLCNPLLTIQDTDRLMTVKRKKLIDACINCDLFKYCRCNCERFGVNCGFPKETFKQYLKLRGDVNNVE